MTKASPCWHHPPPQIFMRPYFLKCSKPKGKQKVMKRIPKAPNYLDKIAATAWKAKAKFVAERSDLKPTDWSSLELYCVNYSIYRKAVADVAERGFSVEGSRGAESRNPALIAKADAERVMIKMPSLTPKNFKKFLTKINLIQDRITRCSGILNLAT